MHIPMFNAALLCVYIWSVKFLTYGVINRYVKDNFVVIPPLYNNELTARLLLCGFLTLPGTSRHVEAAAIVMYVCMYL